jgi:hypothetical protein
MNDWNKDDTVRVRQALEHIHTLSDQDGVSVRGSPKRYHTVLKRDLGCTLNKLLKRFEVSALEYRHIKAACSPHLCCVCKFRFCLDKSACDRCWEAADRTERSRLKLEKRARTNMKRYGRSNYFEGSEGVAAVKEHTFKKYGVTNVMHNPDTRSRFDSAIANRDWIEMARKAKRTSQRRYGVDHWSQRPEKMEEMQQRMLDRHGVSNVMHKKSVRRRWEASMQEIDWKAVYDTKVVATVRKKYGVDNIFQDVERIEQARLAKTGCLGPWSEGAKKRYAEKTGFDHPLRNPEIKAQVQATYRNKTGYNNPFQNPEVLQTHPGHVRKTVTRPEKICGRNNVLQGYEPIVVDILQNTQWVDCIYTGAKVPSVRYEVNGIEHVYHPDLGVRKVNGARFLIEVKSTWTLFGKDDSLWWNLTKFYATKRAGYDLVLALLTGAELLLVKNPYSILRSAYVSGADERSTLRLLRGHERTTRIELDRRYVRDVQRQSREAHHSSIR